MPLEKNICPLISVILPTYNAAQFLNDSIKSILNQTLDDFELIIINDASTDSSHEIITAYTKSDPRIIYLNNQQNLGASASRNKALDIAKGEYIALMDADDICYKERFSHQIHHMTEENIDICGSYIEKFGSTCRVCKYPTSHSELTLNLLCYGRTIPNPTAMIRKSIIGNTRYNQNLTLGEDYDFWLNLTLNNSAKLGNVPEPLVKYRVHPSQASKQLKELTQTLMINILFQNLSQSHEITKEDIELHYNLLQKKHKLSSKDREHYAKKLLLILEHSNLSKTEINKYILFLCKNRLKRNLSTWSLFNLILKNTGSHPKLKDNLLLFLKSLLS